MGDNFFVKAFLAKQISCYFASKSVILDKRQGGLFSGICNNIRRIRRKNYRQSSTYIAEADKSPEIIGQLNAFSAPTIILYYEGKEIHRQAKIINFQEIEKRVRQVQENS